MQQRDVALGARAAVALGARAAVALGARAAVALGARGGRSSATPGQPLVFLLYCSSSLQSKPPTKLQSIRDLVEERETHVGLLLRLRLLLLGSRSSATTPSGRSRSTTGSRSRCGRRSCAITGRQYLGFPGMLSAITKDVMRMAQLGSPHNLGNRGVLRHQTPPRTACRCEHRCRDDALVGFPRPGHPLISKVLSRRHGGQTTVITRG